MTTDHEVVGEALAYLGHDDLRDMGVDSVGHRITILKSVYYIKTSHDVPINDGDYVPVCKS